MNKLDFNAPDHLHLIHTDRTSIHTVKEMRFPSISDVTGDRAYGTVGYKLAKQVTDVRKPLALLWFKIA